MVPYIQSTTTAPLLPTSTELEPDEARTSTDFSVNVGSTAVMMIGVVQQPLWFEMRSPSRWMCSCADVKTIPSSV